MDNDDGEVSSSSSSGLNGESVDDLFLNRRCTRPTPPSSGSNSSGISISVGGTMDVVARRTSDVEATATSGDEGANVSASTEADAAHNDVGRGVVTREAFGDQGAASALAVVLVERALGLFALFALLAIGLATAGDAIDTRDLWWWTALGCAGSCVLVAGIAGARRLAPYLPQVLAKPAARLPTLRDRGAFAVAALLSLVTQALIAGAGWLLLAALAPIDLAASLLVVPLAAATTFLPITVGGAGAREAVYVALCGRLFGMPEADALAASLGLWLAHLLVGGAGGLAQLAARRRP